MARVRALAGRRVMQRADVQKYRALIEQPVTDQFVTPGDGRVAFRSIGGHAPGTIASIAGQPVQAPGGLAAGQTSAWAPVTAGQLVVPTEGLDVFVDTGGSVAQLIMSGGLEPEPGPESIIIGGVAQITVNSLVTLTGLNPVGGTNQITVGA